MKEVVIVQLSVGRNRAFSAVFHVEDVDAIVFFGFAAADVEEIGVVAHVGVWGTSNGFGRVKRIEREGICWAGGRLASDGRGLVVVYAQEVKDVEEVEHLEGE